MLGAVILKPNDSSPILEVKTDAIDLGILKNIVMCDDVARFFHISKPCFDPFLRIEEVFKIRPVIKDNCWHISEVGIVAALWGGGLQPPVER